MTRTEYDSAVLAETQGNLRAAWAAAGGRYTAEGLEWYSGARSYFQSVATQHGLTLDATLAVVAVLSPHCPWEIQLRDTPRFIAAELAQPGSGTHAGYTVNLDKARAILRGADPADVVKGPKVSAFWRNLMGDESAVTLDRHALGVAFNVASATYEKGLPGPKVLRTVRESFRSVAETVGVSPARFQAILWCFWKENQPASIA